MQILLSVWRFCRAKLESLDLILVVCSTLLSTISLMTLIGGAETFGPRTIAVQVGATIVGFIAMIVLANLDYRVLAEKLWFVFLGGSVF